jgi:hypothetical protein
MATPCRIFDHWDLVRALQWAVGDAGFTDPTSLLAFQREQLDPTLDYISYPSDGDLCPNAWTLGEATQTLEKKSRTPSATLAQPGLRFNKFYFVLRRVFLIVIHLWYVAGT